MKTEDKISIASAVVAICALLLTVWEGCETRRHNRTSVRPQLIIDARLRDSDAGLFLTNVGLGPALIRQCRFVVDGTELTSEQLVESLKPKLPELSWQRVLMVTKPGEGQAIPANSDSILLIGYVERPSVTEYSHFLGLLKGVEITVEFESMYGEPFGIKYVQKEKPTIAFRPTR